MTEITGLHVCEEFLTELEEEELIKNINLLKWDSTEIKRRTQHYGFRYSYHQRQSLLVADPITDCIMTYVKRTENYLTKLSEEKKYNFNQVIINEYLSGQGIAPHIDALNVFSDTVVSISLGSDIIMDFSSTYNNYLEIPILLKRRSCIILQDNARYKWKHGITQRKKDGKVKRGVRISLTLRQTL